MRWGLSLIAAVLATLCWLGTMVADPYTTMGAGPQYLRPGVAVISVRFALACTALVGIAAGLVFSQRRNRRSSAGSAFAVLLAIVGGTAIWRLAWLEFVVLP